MVVIGTGKIRTKYIKTKWPIEDGLTAGTTTQKGHKATLEPDKSFLRVEHRKGL